MMLRGIVVAVCLAAGFTFASTVPGTAQSAQSAESEPLEVKASLYAPRGSADIPLRAAAVISIAILSSDSFDATRVDPTSLVVSAPRLRLAGICQQPPQRPVDLNDDGLVDLRCEVHVPTGMLQPGDGLLEIDGRTFDGRRIRSRIAVRLVP